MTKLGIDDLRIIPGLSQIARTSQAGIEMLKYYRKVRIDELWLDHDLGGDDTIMNVVTVLEEAAFNDEPFDIGIVFVHSSNPSGADNALRALQRWGYNARRIPAPACGNIEQS